MTADWVWLLLLLRLLLLHLLALLSKLLDRISGAHNFCWNPKRFADNLARLVAVHVVQNIGVRLRQLHDVLAVALNGGHIFQRHELAPAAITMPIGHKVMGNTVKPGREW